MVEVFFTPGNFIVSSTVRRTESALEDARRCFGRPSETDPQNAILRGSMPDLALSGIPSAGWESRLRLPRVYLMTRRVCAVLTVKGWRPPATVTVSGIKIQAPPATLNSPP